MARMMTEGGFYMWFILGSGLVSLGSAALFALKPEPHKLRFLAGMATTTLFTTATGTVAAVAAVFSAASSDVVSDAQLFRAVIFGLREALANPLLGFAMLAITAFVTAIGLRHLPRKST